MNQISFIIIFISLVSCQDRLDIVEASSDGYWQQLGYGKIINLQDSIITVYDICKVDCHLSFQEEILDFGRIKKVTKDSLTIQHGIDDWKFFRIDELPKICSATIEKNLNSPQHNFETFWHTFNENYCSFDIKGIDWNKMYKEIAPKISDKTSDIELYLILEEMTNRLEDGHVSLELPDNIEEEYLQLNPVQKKRYSKTDEFAISEKLANIYVDSLRTYNSGMVRWGMINGHIGYIQFNAMLMVANYYLNPELALNDFGRIYWGENVELYKDEIQRKQEADGANYILHKILLELKKANSFILDLRFNGGGKDGVALNLLNHFTEEHKIVASKQSIYLGEIAIEQDISVSPSSNTFNGEVFLLTSHQTSSAAELAVLTSLCSPNFTKIGSQTEGIFSSTLDKTLPNGWEYELSNEIYRDTKNRNYEHIGIPPDYELNYPEEAEGFFQELENQLSEQKDNAIDLAIKLQKEINER